MRVSAMYYRKPNMLITILFLLGLSLTTGAVADNATDEDGMYFKGSMATCLSRAKIVFPCVSFSPPAYQANTIFVSDLPLGADLPLDADKRTAGTWLDRLSDGEFWSIDGLFSGAAQSLDMNFNVDQSKPGMNMNLGPMKLNMYVDEGRISESQFFLGFDHSW